MQDDAAVEGVRELVPEPGEVSRIACVEGAGGLDLDADDLAGGGFEDQVDLAGLVSVPKVVGGDRGG